MNTQHEWLETDGLGGFASGTATLARTRRYHALLMHAGPPSRRFILVNGFDAHVITPDGRFALSAQHYAPGVTAPDGVSRLESFTAEPWPTWIFRLPCGRAVRQEIFIAHGHAATVVNFTIEGDRSGCSLELRPFFSGRDPHSLQRENGGFAFSPTPNGNALVWSAYEGVPPVAINTHATYHHDPVWYRNFLYETERDRGLDCMEDLAAPGIFRSDFSEAGVVFIFSSPMEGKPGEKFLNENAPALALKLRVAESNRRAAFASPLHKAADDYLVRRGEGHTIIAGYPWFTDWGRDTFIALRGLVIATGRLEIARSILLEWSAVVSQGMLPNFFPDGGKEPEYNSVDASLWYVVAIHDYLSAMAANGGTVPAEDSRRLAAAVNAILEGYSTGTRFGIRADTDGLLYAGQSGVQLTWMDAKIGDWVVTPRIGKPVEIQALWINALRIGTRFNQKWQAIADRAQENFAQRFWDEETGQLVDVVDVDFTPGRRDASSRPNQIFAVGGLPFPVLTGPRAERVVQAVEQQLLTPLGLRSLAPTHENYCPRYTGGVRERDGAYHQGTVWPWLIGPFVEAWVATRGNTNAARAEATERFIAPLQAHLREAGLGHISEVADAEVPHASGGCPFQAWSLGELLRLELRVLKPVVGPAPVVSASPSLPRETSPRTIAVPALVFTAARDAAPASFAFTAFDAPDFYRL